MRNEDEFYCGRTELAQEPRRRNILVPFVKAKELNVPCGTEGNPHECIREVISNIIHGSRFRCRKCNKHFQLSEGHIITITWINE